MAKISENKIIEILKRYDKLTYNELLKKFKIKTKKEKRKLRDTLKDLEIKGKIYRTSNKYMLPKEDIVIGKIEFTKNGNMAFVADEKGNEIAISPEHANEALHGDIVAVKIKGKWRDLPAGRVIKIVQRGSKKVVGIFERKRIFGFVVPISSKITTDFYVAPENINGAKDRQVVEAEIIKYASKGRNPEVKITRVLGYINDPKVDLPIVIIKHDLPNPGEFPKDVIKEAKKIPKKVSPEEIKRRKDFREETIVTIDGDDAKDFDDAVQVKRLPNGNYLLGVHIADVSYYVKEGSALDKEAYNRGTSVYLLDTVIPMLPHELSDWICSLVEGEDRLTMSLLMEIDKSGDVVDFEIYEGVIRSKKRLTYSKVNKLLSGEADEEIINDIGFLEKDLKLMEELMYILRENRRKRGAILDIESGEIKVITDENGYVIDIVPRKRGISEVIIEEFMIKANETIAQIFDDQGLPFIYRVHEEPDPDVIFQLKNYLEAMGIKAKFPQTLHPRALQEILEKTKDHPLRPSIEKLMVRSLKRALYSDVNIGHFGLASSSYTHFTSPIRRYPDLIVHRLLRKYLRHGGTLTKSEIEKYTEILPSIAYHSSKRERLADEAEWDLWDMKKVEYMLNHIGEEFEVYVTNVTRFGLFVEIPEKLISGLVHISDLGDDYFIYDEEKNVLIGERTGKVYKIGDKLKVRARAANKITLEIDFEIPNHELEYEERELRKEYPNAKIKIKSRRKKKTREDK